MVWLPPSSSLLLPNTPALRSGKHIHTLSQYSFVQWVFAVLPTKVGLTLCLCLDDCEAVCLFHGLTLLLGLDMIVPVYWHKLAFFSF